jgi:inactivated superfamily I helicase
MAFAMAARNQRLFKRHRRSRTPLDGRAIVRGQIGPGSCVLYRTVLSVQNGAVVLLGGTR